MPTRSICLLGISVIAGCAPGPLDADPATEPVPLGADMQPPRPAAGPDAGAPPSPFVEPTGTLTLRVALAASLRESPTLAALGYELRASEADALQAGRAPNPELGLTIENFGGSGVFSGFDAAETTVTLSQLVELGGKRVQRGRVADLEAELAGWDHEILRMDVLTKTTADFIAVLASSRRLEIARDTTGLAARVEEAIRRQVDAGDEEQIDATKAQFELVRARLAEEEATHELAAARMVLAANWGSMQPRFDEAQGDLDTTPAPPVLPTLLSRVRQNPDLARWTAETALRQAQIELARAQGVPDLTIGGGVRYIDGDDQTVFVIDAGIPLPLADTNRDALRAARLRALQGNELEEAAIVRINTAVAEAHETLLSIHHRAELIRDTLLPTAREAFDAAAEAFDGDRIEALDLLDTQRSLFDARRELVDALQAYHRAVLALERLTGAALFEERESE
ncbi:MAG: TolC family protein [Planctomycetota bacterium]|jgi:cobalt-zinc-cadmium efflux system outer membrane protein